MLSQRVRVNDGDHGLYGTIWEILTRKLDIQNSVFDIHDSNSPHPSPLALRAFLWREREYTNIPSIVGRALNNPEVFQHSLGPHVPCRVLKNPMSFSARDGHGRGMT